MSDFQSVPHAGWHGITGGDWRGLDGLVSYGNYAGPGNRNGVDPRADGQPWAPIDGIDAAAQRHDQGYTDAGIGPNKGMFSWEGINATRNADRQLADDTDQEMRANGGQYSGSADAYSRAMRGIFRGRSDTVDAVNWVGNKAGEARDGIGNFVNGMGNWNSAGDAINGIGSGIRSGASWLGNTVREGGQGLANAGRYFKGLGGAGMAGAAFGIGSSLFAGAKHLGGNIASGVGNAVSNGAGAVANGARSVGGAIAGGARKAWNAVSSW
jgi:hypothetical protein